MSAVTYRKTPLLAYLQTPASPMPYVLHKNDTTRASSPSSLISLGLISSSLLHTLQCNPNTPSLDQYATVLTSFPSSSSPMMHHTPPPLRCVSTSYPLSFASPLALCSRCALIVFAFRPRYALPALTAARRGIVEGRLSCD